MSPPIRDAAPQAVDLAIVGGGPAGLAAALAATRMAPDWRVLWLRGRADFGPAYATRSPLHRLNVPVERMGLDPAQPMAFHEWLQARDGERAPAAGCFVPRGDFGRYLHAMADGLPPGLRQEAGFADALRPQSDGWRLAWRPLAPSAAGPASVEARRVLLAFGLPEPTPPEVLPVGWVADPWAWWLALPDAWVPPPLTDEVLVVGSGLTAVDMVLGLRARGFAGRLRVVSPGGAWSQAHAATPPLDVEARHTLERLLCEADGVGEACRVIRGFARRHPWRAVIDALRPTTNALWAAWPPSEQRRALRHLFGPWNRHRHRMAPDVRVTLGADVALSIERGRIDVDAEGRVLKRHRGVVEVMAPALVLDCRGPGFRQALRGDTLLARLVREGVLQANPLGTGVARPMREDLDVIGAALFGERFETTAVPELRQQAVEAVQRWATRDQPASANQSRGTR